MAPKEWLPLYPFLESAFKNRGQRGGTVKKTILAVLLVLLLCALCMGLTGCGGDTAATELPFSLRPRQRPPRRQSLSKAGAMPMSCWKTARP